MESPLFKIGGDPIYFVTPQQVDFLCDIFAKMQVELASEYIHKYDAVAQLREPYYP